MPISRSIRQVNIGSRKIPVRWKKDICEDVHGYYKSVPNPHIELCSKLDEKEKVYTLWHEVFEAVSDMYGLEIPEQGIRVLENVVVGIIRNNPKLVEYTQGLDKKSNKKKE
jgi:hypothetical protein